MTFVTWVYNRFLLAKFINDGLKEFGMGNIASAFFFNKIFLATFIAAVLSQAAKITIILLAKRQKFTTNDLIVTGGMPSSHSAMVGALSTIIGLTEGFTPLFFVVLTFSMLVLRDAMGIRRSVGEEGKLIEKLFKRERIKIDKFHYSLGHTPVQVSAGLLIGVVSAILVYYVQ